jgi:hypothetical protein
VEEIGREGDQRWEVGVGVREAELEAEDSGCVGAYRLDFRWFSVQLMGSD